ncbi:hypothetical protein JTE90_012087 [Oedothorax gibbosus]|uniref:Uncharacterized protein n=1 Tax=Oedothorax gibbosus TaxID=931172 RepID=A0AAV6UMK1_9ARAC|nr:hypothetical protein JTE90_012087 [Oedothorax gibbosus]
MTDRVRKPSAMQRLRRRVAERDEAEVIAFERRVLAGATASIPVALLLWSVAVGTDFWFHVTPESGSPIYVNKTDSFFVRSYSGLWTICKFLYLNGSMQGAPIKTCHNHRLFPSEDFIQKNPEVDRTILDYTRTESAFAIISFCMMTMSFCFSLYTFKETRYMFKRLAAGVHFIGAACVLVVVEVVVNSVEYEERFLTDRHPKGATWSYGYSFFLACLSGVIMALCGITFLLCSKKRKGVLGADEPNILGR